MSQAQSIYIHIPFCKTKCPYCDFASWANKEHLIQRYFNALLYEIRTKCEAYINQSLSLGPIKTIFLGGGTPSLIPPEYYKKLFKELKNYFSIEKDCEITLELNPGTAREDYLLAYKDLGVNRISIGAQSFNNKTLEVLGRGHSVDDIIHAVNLTKSAQIDNFNLDLIYSVPEMTKEIWNHTINKALELNPKHISAYSLTIEAGTPFEKIYANSKKLPSEDFSYELYFELCKTLKESSFIHYEISNFAKKGFESKHNLTYWLGKEYYAFGVSAHKYLNGIRSHNNKNLEAYIANPLIETITEYNLNFNLEKIILNSRLNTGLEINLLEKTTTKTSKELIRLLNDLSDEGLVEIKKKNISLSEKGMFLNNEILAKLL